ncbi:MAG: M56 family metallopeptidase [Bacteroidia bacterium]
MSFWTGFIWITSLHLILGALYLVFKKQLNNARLNRILLLSLLLLPFLVWIPMPATLVNRNMLATFILPEFKLGTATEYDSNAFNWSLLYLGIGVFFMAYKLRGLVNISRWVHSARKEAEHRLRIYRSPNIPMPCSFFSAVFIPYGLTEKNEEWIIAHEQVHVRQFHSADLLLTNLISALFWINPVVHLLQKELRLNHEYLADEGVMRNNDNAQEYMKIILANALKRLLPFFFIHFPSIPT